MWAQAELKLQSQKLPFGSQIQWLKTCRLLLWKSAGRRIDEAAFSPRNSGHNVDLGTVSVRLPKQYFVEELILRIHDADEPIRLHLAQNR